ncbi:nitrate reductase cytochrome c-type subunit [Kiloniella laminariae]|uniref:nitrate reductase cytochrome c-type subunit n=1 Tax=Kiloniella laminariae TaxID=454162 RepID=UPI00037D0880|nr:nitrate reductase cytochrome c-type subunit [Kiloniella laminariae]
MKRILINITTALGLVFYATSAFSDGTATLRQGTPITSEAEAPPITKEENTDVKRVRNYPEQPPTIPHQIRDYQITLNANKCLSCHARTRTGESQAPMVSVTHYMDRDNQVLATVSPRRYFCNQCHVTQVSARPLVENEFIDVEDLIKGEQ